MGDNTQTSTSTTGSADPHVTSTLHGLLDDVDSIRGAGPQVFGQSLYSPAGSTTHNSWQSMMDAASNPSYGNGINSAMGYANGLIGSGGMTSDMSRTVGQLQNTGDQYRAFAGGANQPSLTESTMMDTALGKNFGQNDPGYATIRQGVIDDTLKNVGDQFTSSGRFGGGSYMQGAGEGVGNAVAGLDYSNYQSDVARQQQALQAIEGQRQQGRNNQITGLQGAQGADTARFGLGQQGVSNAMGASQMLPALFQGSTLPAALMGQVGAAQDADAQAQLSGNADLFDRTHNARMGLLGALTQAFNGQAGAGGTTTTNTQPGTPWWQTILGGGLGLAGLLGR